MSYLLPKIKNLKEYIPGKQPDNEDWIKLNTNEAAFPPSPKIFAYLKSLQSSKLLTRYPNIDSQPAKKTIAKLYNISPQQIIIGNGSDELLRLIIHATSDVSHPIAISEITYSLYKTIADSYEVPTEEVSILSKDTLNTSLEGLKNTSANTIFLPNPNAQTGEFIHPQKLASYISKSKKMWVIDEAYNDFVEGESEYSCIEIAKKYTNLIVTRTLSKSYSLAGIRFGYAYSSNQELMKGLYKICDSYNQDSLTLQLANIALEDQEYYKQCILDTFKQRTYLRKKLIQFNFTVLPSQGNFILTKPPNTISAEHLFHKLSKKKILIRHFSSHPILKEYLRISIGSKQENEIFIASIQEISKDFPS